MTEIATPYAANQVTWCQTRSGYADETFHCDTAADHDHDDVVVGQDGVVLFRVWPDGTLLLLPDGRILRAREGVQDFNDMIAAEEAGDDPRAVPRRPRYDIWTAGGGVGATSWYFGLLDGAVVLAPALGDARPAPGSLYLRPNGEAWRLRGYNFIDLYGDGTYLRNKSNWVIALPSGAMTSGHTLPEDARLVYAP